METLHKTKSLPDCDTKHVPLLSILASLFIFFGALLIVVTRRIEIVFGDVSFDQVLFHMLLPRDTVDSAVFRNVCSVGWAIKSFLFSSFLLIIFSLSLIRRKTYLYLSRCMIFCGKRPDYICFLISLFFVFSGVTLFCYKLNVVQAIRGLCNSSTIVDEHYVSVQLDDFMQIGGMGVNLNEAKKPNLILIVSESLEATYSNPKYFPEDLLHELTEIKREADSIDNLYQVNGCHYTIASMYAVQYGLPLLYLHCSNGSPVQKNVFHKNCLSIFDVLEYAGYKICHLQGTSLKFAGQGTLFSHLRNVKCIGLDEIQDTEYSNRQDWGLWDSDLFEIAKKEVSMLATNQRPFALSLQTIDTHGGNVLQPGRERRYCDHRDIIRLQSKLISEFVRWVEEQEYGNDTVIVILGDHALMSRKLGTWNFVPKDERRVFNCIIHSHSGRRMRNVAAGMFDFAPTILDALSFHWPTFSFGIGHSLYRDAPTIVEKLGVEVWDEESRKRSMKYTQLIRN